MRSRRRLLRRLAALTAGTAALLGPLPAAAGATSAAPPPPAAAVGPPQGAAESAVAPPSRATGATVAGVVAPAQAWSQPGSGRRVWHLGTQTAWTGEPQVLLVLSSAWRGGREWLRVLLPIRPDGSAGWIPRDDAVLSSTPYWITVDKRARQVRAYRSGTLVRAFPAVIGKPATPTPDGLAAIYEIDRQSDPTGFIGSWALPLTILSNTLSNFGGGPGRIAIHGRGGASLNDPLGSARSHGCVRVDNSQIAWLARTVPQGTPVQISG